MSTKRKSGFAPRPWDQLSESTKYHCYRLKDPRVPEGWSPEKKSKARSPEHAAKVALRHRGLELTDENIAAQVELQAMPLNIRKSFTIEDGQIVASEDPEVLEERRLKQAEHLRLKSERAVKRKLNEAKVAAEEEAIRLKIRAEQIAAMNAPQEVFDRYQPVEACVVYLTKESVNLGLERVLELAEVSWTDQGVSPRTVIFRIGSKEVARITNPNPRKGRVKRPVITYV